MQFFVFFNFLQYSGDTVQLIDTSDSQYWYVYSQKLGKNGYVNKDYLIGRTTTYATRTVSVATGYLALRSAKAYDSSNEIGQLYSGDTVQLVDTTDVQYWESLVSISRTVSPEYSCPISLEES